MHHFLYPVLDSAWLLVAARNEKRHFAALEEPPIGENGLGSNGSQMMIIFITLSDSVRLGSFGA